jgi:hypothetical protein
MTEGATPKSTSGAHWLRWEPHVHAPGTVLNDQFKGTKAWDEYLSRLEDAAPTLRAIGITDYYSTETYERVLEAKAAGRLPNTELIFPNIEMRFDIGTVKGRFVNVHLLVSPEDPNHLTELKRFLSRLMFKAHEDTYSCTRDDLIRLGRRADGKIHEELKALEYGSEQFKVDLDGLRNALRDNAWARANILIAVAGSEVDGTSGVRAGADKTLRQEIERFANVIFASSEAQRDFWLGKKSLSVEQICEHYGSLKPCLHGSDAHDHQKVGAPDGDRYSWIKGMPAFDTLRQACIDPEGRAYVGESPPSNASPSQCIAAIEIADAAWAATPNVALNPGFVAIIGARGSGKTALADVIARGCDAIPDDPSEASFLRRASDLLGSAVVRLAWHDGDNTERRLDGSDAWSVEDYPRARYLSQQFVEDLCSAHGITDELIAEIERVIFESHPMSERDGAVSFDEMLQLRAERFRLARDRQEELLSDISERIGIEGEKSKRVAELKKSVADKNKFIATYDRDRKGLIKKGTEDRVERLNALSDVAEKVRGNLRYFANQEQALLTLQDEVESVKKSGAPDALRKLKERHRASRFEAEVWERFLLTYKGDVDSALKEAVKKARDNHKAWKGTKPPAHSDPNTSYLEDGLALDDQSLADLEAEIGRYQQLVNVDRATAERYAAISKKIDNEKLALEQAAADLEDCEGAKERAKALVVEREATYRSVFDAVLSEQQVLLDLYAPLMARLQAATGTLNKLSFSVRREANVEEWASEGEELLDLRRQGAFRGQGRLLELGNSYLKDAWENGGADAVSAAMAHFRDKHPPTIIENAPVPKSGQDNYREWSKRFAKWLYGTKHVRIRYSIDYDGTDIRKLSPGTRGIVLLLLYLALDDADDRPLIIDQPEENLDPKSIFDELVGLFREAKKKRQVIMVTHNANLVINADADQIIIATAGAHAPGELPPITYVSGGLEEAHIRRVVCDILEGGERAFQERARRLRVKLDR